MELITVKEAAVLLGRSERTVYAYLGEGKLRGMVVKKRMRLDEEDVRAFVAQPPGRQRMHEAEWHEPQGGNSLWQTCLRVPVCPGRQAEVKKLLRRMREEQTHRFAGTVSRSVSWQPDDPRRVLIVLTWRACIRPPVEQREREIAALGEYFAGVLDWEHAEMEEHQVLLHA